jgi:PKD repeat protein
MKVSIALIILMLLLILVFTACMGGGGMSCEEEHTPATPDPNLPLRADFVADQTRMSGKGTINFTQLATGNVKEYYWDLNGDGAIDFTGPIAHYWYHKNGYYSITLTVESWDGTRDTLTKPDYIYVYGCSD